MRTIRGGSPQALRQRNKRVMLERLLDAPDGLTRPELARALELTVPAVATLISGNGESLAAVIDVLDASLPADRVANSGPAPKVIRLKRDLGYVIGVDLSHTRVEVAIADLFGGYDTQLDTYAETWNVEDDLHGALAAAATIVQRLSDDHGVLPDQIAAIGLAIAAPVNADSDAHPLERTGRLRVDLGGRYSPWANIDPLAALTNHLAALPDGACWSAIPLHIDNDSNLGALAELKRGAARGRRNVFYLHIDEAGVGGGIVIDGQIYRGSGGIAGEFGHVVIDPAGREECPRCGHSCVEATVLAMLGYPSDERHHRRPLLELVESAIDGDVDAQRAITEAAEYLGDALAGFVTLLNFDRIVVGGPFPPQAYGLVIPAMQRALARRIISPVAKDYVMQLGILGERAILDGAVWLALKRARIEYLLLYAAHGGPRSRASDFDPVRRDGATRVLGASETPVPSDTSNELALHTASQLFQFSSRSVSGTSRNHFAGALTTTVRAGTIRVTTAPAPTKASSPMSTPGRRTAPPPMRQARRRVAPRSGISCECREAVWSFVVIAQGPKKT